MLSWGWYLPKDVIKQYMDLAGLSGPLEDSNPDFEQAETTLGQLSFSAEMADAQPSDSDNMLYYGEVNLRGKTQQIELTVEPARDFVTKFACLVGVRLK